MLLLEVRLSCCKLNQVRKSNGICSWQTGFKFHHDIHNEYYLDYVFVLFNVIMSVAKNIMNIQTSIFKNRN